MQLFLSAIELIGLIQFPAIFMKFQIYFPLEFAVVYGGYYIYYEGIIDLEEVQIIVIGF